MKTVSIPSKIIRTHKDGKVDTYHVRRAIGKGGFATVYEVSRVNSDEKFAIKAIPLANLKDDGRIKRQLEEINIQTSLNHPNILRSYDYFKDNFNLYMVLELCPYNTVHKFLKDKGKFSEFDAADIIYQVLEGVKYLHQNSIIHRDIKLQNLLIGSDGNIKISDFGISIKLSSQIERCYSTCGTYGFMPPEMLMEDNDGYSFETDIWSIGVCTFLLLTGQNPFASKDKVRTEKLIRNAEYRIPPHCHLSFAAKDFIRSILQANPENRPSLDDLINHPFITNSQKTPHTNFFINLLYENQKKLKQQQKSIEQQIKLQEQPPKQEQIPPQVQFSQSYKPKKPKLYKPSPQKQSHQRKIDQMQQLNQLAKSYRHKHLQNHDESLQNQIQIQLQNQERIEENNQNQIEIEENKIIENEQKEQQGNENEKQQQKEDSQKQKQKKKDRQKEDDNQQNESFEQKEENEQNLSKEENQNSLNQNEQNDQNNSLKQQEQNNQSYQDHFLLSNIQKQPKNLETQLQIEQPQNEQQQIETIKRKKRHHSPKRSSGRQISPKNSQQIKEIVDLPDKNNENNNVTINENSIPSYCVIRFCTKSKKGDLYYFMKNGQVGMISHDHQRLVLDPFGEFIQMWSNNEKKKPKIMSPNEADQNKNVSKLLKYEKAFKESNKHLLELPTSKPQKGVPMRHVKYWMDNESGLMFRMDNRVIQVNFTDKSKLIVFWEQKSLIFAQSLFENGTFMTFLNLKQSKDSELKQKYSTTKKMVDAMNKGAW